MEIEQVKEPPCEFPYWKPLRRKLNPDSVFFASGDVHRELLAKQVALDFTEDEKQRVLCTDDYERNIFCPIVGCGGRLNSLEGFEDHYIARHTASCSVCSRVYPTQRLLGIHVSEVHDSFFQAKIARGFAMYECLVEPCGLKFKSYKARHQHLVDKHKFPVSFQFYKKAHPSKKQREKHLCKHALHTKEDSTSAMEVEKKTIDNLVSKKQREKHMRKHTLHTKEDSSAMEVEKEAIDDLVSAVTKLSTSDCVPSSIRFGHRRGRGLTFVPRSVERRGRPDSSPTATKRQS